MNELKCFECEIHIGWITDSGPIGLTFCDECHESNIEKELNECKEHGESLEKGYCDQCACNDLMDNQ